MKAPELRQQLISAACYALRMPFWLLNLVQRLFAGRTWQQPRSILVIKPCCLGDLLMTTPLLEVIQQAYPDATISYAAGSWSKVIPEHHPAIHEVIDSGSVGIPGRYSLSDYRKFARTLRAKHCDMAFVLDRSPLVALLPWLAGIPRRVGLDSLGRGFSLTDRVPTSSSPTHLQHQAEIYLDLARAIHLPIQHPRMAFNPTSEERAAVPRASGLQIALLPGGGSNPGMQLTAKRWPLEHYQELARRLIETLHAHILLIGGPDDLALNQQLLDGLTEHAAQISNLAGKTSLGEVAAYYEQSALFIGNDSSPMHLAAAVGIPVIAIFGPTSPQEYGPYPPDDPNNRAIWHHPTGQPCFFLGKMRTCPGCTCMQAVTVDEVWQTAQQLLASSKKHNTEVRS